MHAMLGRDDAQAVTGGLLSPPGSGQTCIGRGRTVGTPAPVPVPTAPAMAERPRPAYNHCDGAGPLGPLGPSRIKRRTMKLLAVDRKSRSIIHVQSKSKMKSCARRSITPIVCRLSRLRCRPRQDQQQPEPRWRRPLQVRAGRAPACGAAQREQQQQPQQRAQVQVSSARLGPWHGLGRRNSRPRPTWHPLTDAGAVSCAGARGSTRCTRACP